ncbi:helix-turn-helix transcriptional regulator [Mesoterricola silvestris]|uniref:WYL domain-containing protein n=1 Tax=Mesoterricola silvestris TaxID=2927979 RepID=A0AA48KA78_9BACT|nr:WYL domain-containing protein [Mesoterricola silvestris]BDU73835.1 hypothetical protein METEAL_30090 [Mesoterricola silvestris]
MAPRKSTKVAAAPEAGTPEAAPEPKTVKPRTRKVAAPAEPAAPKAARKSKAAAAPAPEPAAVEPEPAVPPAPAPAADPLTAPARAVLQAIQDGVAVELLFIDAEANPPRTFEPRQLIFDALARQWFVWGWDRRYNAERHHRLDLIAQVGPVEGMGRAAQGPYKEGTAANLIGGWLGGEPIRVKAVLLKQWIFAVRQAPAPFPEFAIEEMEEGKAQVTFVATDLRAIARWAMQFGDGIQVVEPQRLQDRIKQVGMAWAGKAAAAPSPAPDRSASDRPRRDHGHKEHRSEHRSERESRDREPREREAAPEPRRRPEPPRHIPEPPKPTVKAGKIEIRIDRL